MKADDTQDMHWLWEVLMHYTPLYVHVAIASVVINLLGLALPLFVMNVYDRIVPNSAFESLWVLAIGAVLAVAFDMTLRTARVRFVDLAGRNADVILLGRFMDALLDTRLDASPTASVGGLISKVREFEYVREFLASSSLLAVLDLPFILLFIALIALLGGWLAWLPLLALPLMFALAFVTQIPFRRSSELQMRHATNKNALLGELATGFETVRAARLERHMLRRWDQAVDDAAVSAASARTLGAVAAHSAQFATALLYIALIVGGVYQISAGAMSMGALIACSILLGRCTGPLISLVQLFNHAHKTRRALQEMHALLQLPRENPVHEQYAHSSFTEPEQDDRPTRVPDMANSAPSTLPHTVAAPVPHSVPGSMPSSMPESESAHSTPGFTAFNSGSRIQAVDIRLEKVSFRYPGKHSLADALHSINMHIRTGERVAILGASGSGKTSLARICAGLYQPSEGRVLYGSTDLSLLPMRDVRRKLGFLPQTIHLFSGTVRDNIVMGWPGPHAPSEAELVAVAELAGVMDFAREHPLGLDMPLGEHGRGLSGGQAQAVALARALAGEPATLMLDEPASNLDGGNEARLIQRLAAFVPGRTLIVLTHRAPVLRLVQRAIVLDKGCIVADGPVHEVVHETRAAAQQPEHNPEGIVNPL